MKIATWNLARVQTKSKIPAILEKIKEINADIWILTETSSQIYLSANYSGFQSIPLPANEIFDTVSYKKGENRTTIWSKFSALEKIETANNYTNTCEKLQTPYGNLVVYGTIIGILAYKKPFFQQDLNNVIYDGNQLAKHENFCLAGDFNLSFCDNYFTNKKAREELIDFFDNNNLVNLTQNIPNNIDHIVISKDFIKDYKADLETWNHDFKLSDHLGVSVNLAKI